MIFKLYPLNSNSPFFHPPPWNRCLRICLFQLLHARPPSSACRQGLATLTTCIRTRPPCAHRGQHAPSPFTRGYLAWFRLWAVAESSASNLRVPVPASQFWAYTQKQSCCSQGESLLTFVRNPQTLPPHSVCRTICHPHEQYTKTPTSPLLTATFPFWE